jgi:hypothetical protein
MMFLLVLFLLFGVGGCRAPRGPTKDAEGRSDGAAMGPAPSATPPAMAGCTSDGDCRTWASYCAETPCVCASLTKTEPDPKCSSPNTVSCYANPCIKRAAACQAGRCELVIGP